LSIPHRCGRKRVKHREGRKNRKNRVEVDEKIKNRFCPLP
jgi:hypothetical protein